QELLALKGHTDIVRGVAFSRDGQRVATASSDRTAKVWDAHTGQEIFSLKGHTERMTGVVFSPDGERLASSSEDETAKVWDARTGQQLLSLMGHTGQPLPSPAGHTSALWGVIFSPDGRWLVAASRDQTAKVWDARTGEEVRTLQGHTEWVTNVAFS